MRLVLLVSLVLTMASLHAHAAAPAGLSKSARSAMLQGLNKLAASLRNLQRQATSTEDQQRLSHVSDVLMSFQFRLMNGRIYEKSATELLAKLKEKIREASPQQIDNQFEDTQRSLLEEATKAGSDDDVIPDPECAGTPPNAPELVLNELTDRCTKNAEFHDVLGCVGAATIYCHKVFPQKSDSQLLGLVTNKVGNALTVTCLDRSGLIFSPDARTFTQHGRHGDEQLGSGRVCELHHGSEYAGVFADRVTTKALGEDQESLFMAGCFPAAKKIKVRYSELQSAGDKECRAGNPVRGYACLKSASAYCKNHFGYSGGIVQFWHTHEVAEVVCYNAFYTGKVYIARDNDFLEAKNSLEKVCSIEFKADMGKILEATPDAIHTGRFDNRLSSVPLQDTFEFKKSVTTTNQFRHSHSFSISAELTVKVKVPLVAEKTIKISTSYTAGISFTKTNTMTTEFTHTSTIIVPPGKGIAKKAVVTRAKLDVPWRAVGITGAGKRVEVSGTWSGVDVADLRTEQVDL